MNITSIAIKNNRVTYLILLVIVFIGLSTFNELPRDSMPPFTIRNASIVTSFPGAAPERVEMLISDKIEKVVQEIPEVDYINSESRTGLSVVSVALKEDTPAERLQDIWDRMRRKVDNIKNTLPKGIYGPTVKDEDIGVVYGISVGLKNDGFEYAEMKDYAEDLRDELIKLSNSAKVDIGGIIEERVFIDFDDSKLARYGISSVMLKNIISSTNIIVSSGQINFEGERVILESSGSFETVDDIKNIRIPVGKNGQTVALSEITKVYKDYIDPKETVIKLNGKDALVLSVSLKDGANIVHLGKEIDELVSKYNKELPVGIEAVRIASQDYDVNANIDNFVDNVIQSVVIVLAVMLLFLGIRTGFVVASLIPLAIILTLMLMGTFNVGLNQVSLAALIMALGMLVDNAIVMVESIMVKMEKGKTSIESAVESSKELLIPLLISSLTTSAAFLSFFMAESVMGEIMGQLFSVITLSLLSSWLMSFTIIPLLAVVFVKIKKHTDDQKKKKSIFDLLNVYYNRLLDFSLKRTKLVMFSILFTFILSFFGFRLLPFVFMPDSERNLLTLDFNLPLGTDIKTTEQGISKIETFIADSLLVNDTREEGITSWASFIGKGPKSYDLSYFPGEANSGYAHILINTSSAAANQMVIDKIDEFSFYNSPDAEVVVKRLVGGGGSAVPIQVRVSGDSPKELFTISAKVKSFLRKINGTKSITDSWGPKIKKFRIEIDQNQLDRSGITNNDIATSLKTLLSGNNIGEFREDDISIPIIMRSEDSEKISFQDIEGLSIFAQNSGKSVPLVQVAKIIPEWQYAKISRRDLTKTITINSQLVDGVTASEVISQLRPMLDEYALEWDSGYSYEFGGESEGSGKAMSAVSAKLPISGFIILLLLVLQFNSIRKTGIILSTIPLGVVGVIGGLLLTGSYMSFTGFLGVISLAGIVINNAIVLIDRIEIEQNEFSRNPLNAIVFAANERFRPILLTTFTTSLGLIPLWFGGGVMWEPMAIGIIFGLLFATIITLVFVPMMYKIMYKVKYQKSDFK
jgi:multidrug efflux pump subunit AcrB